MPFILTSSAEDLAHKTSLLHTQVDYFSHAWTLAQTHATQRLIWYRKDLLTSSSYTRLTATRCENLLWRLQHKLRCTITTTSSLSNRWRNRFEKFNAPLQGPLFWGDLCRVRATQVQDLQRRGPAVSVPVSPLTRQRRLSADTLSPALKPALKRSMASSSHLPSSPILNTTEALCLHRLQLDHLDLAGQVSRRQLCAYAEKDPWSTYLPLTHVRQHDTDDHTCVTSCLGSPVMTTQDAQYSQLRKKQRCFRFNVNVERCLIVDAETEVSQDGMMDRIASYFWGPDPDDMGVMQRSQSTTVPTRERVPVTTRSASLTSLVKASSVRIKFADDDREPVYDLAAMGRKQHKHTQSQDSLANVHAETTTDTLANALIEYAGHEANFVVAGDSIDSSIESTSWWSIAASDDEDEADVYQVMDKRSPSPTAATLAANGVGWVWSVAGDVVDLVHWAAGVGF